MNNLILVIDDSSESLGLLYELLTEAEYEVFIFQNSHLGINAATSKFPQLILLELLRNKKCL